MECRDPGGWGDSTAAPVRTTGFGGAARVLSTHDAGTNDVNSSLGCTAPNRKCSHFSWVRGHLALADAWERGPPARTVEAWVRGHLAYADAWERGPPARTVEAWVRGPPARMVRSTVGPIVRRISTPSGGGFQTRPYHAVTSVRRAPETEVGVVPNPPLPCGDGYDR